MHKICYKIFHCYKMLTVASFSLLVNFITFISNFCNVYLVSFKVFHINQLHFKRKTGHLTLKFFKIQPSTDARVTKGPTKKTRINKFDKRSGENEKWTISWFPKMVAKIINGNYFPGVTNKEPSPQKYENRKK